MVYRLLRSTSRRALSWFYSRIDVEGVERIPARTPVLLAVNHPNALVDAMVVALICPRRLGFTARATLFTNPLVAAFLRAAGVVPLIRQKDVAELGATSDAERNARAFAAINRARPRARDADLSRRHHRRSRRASATAHRRGAHCAPRP